MVPRFSTCIFLAATILAQTQPNDPVGFVKSNRGRWRDESRPPDLVAFSTIYRNSRIRHIDSQRKDDFIELRFLPGNRVAKFSCSAALVCTEPLDLQPIVDEVLTEHTPLERVFRAVLRMFEEDPRPYTVAITRRHPGWLSDGVVKAGSYPVDIGDIFKPDTAGYYPVEIVPVAAPLPLRPNVSVLERKGRAYIKDSRSTFSPGLYRMILLEPIDVGEFFRSEDNAMVLIVPEMDYVRIEAAFSEAKQLAGRYLDGADDAEVRSFMRAYLASLNPRKLWR